MDEVDWGRDCYPGSQLKSSEQKEWTPPLSSVGAVGLYEEKHKPVFKDRLIDHSYPCGSSIYKQSSFRSPIQALAACNEGSLVHQRCDM